MRTTIRNLIVLFSTIGVIATIFVFVSVASALFSPANAANAKWAEVKGWTIMGNSDDQSCWARLTYDDGITMAIAFTQDDKASWLISGLTAQPGQEFKIAVVASNGDRGIMPAIGIEDGVVVFPDINKVSIRALANARQIYINGLGSYDLSGSKAAMLKAWECYETLNSY